MLGNFNQVLFQQDLLATRFVTVLFRYELQIAYLKKCVYAYAAGLSFNKQGSTFLSILNYILLALKYFAAAVTKNTKLLDLISSLYLNCDKISNLLKFAIEWVTNKQK